MLHLDAQTAAVVAIDVHRGHLDPSIVLAGSLHDPRDILVRGEGHQNPCPATGAV